MLGNKAIGNTLIVFLLIASMVGSVEYGAPNIVAYVLFGLAALQGLVTIIKIINGSIRYY